MKRATVWAANALAWSTWPSLTRAWIRLEIAAGVAMCSGWSLMNSSNIAAAWSQWPSLPSVLPASKSE